jgi:predicted MFS family arabinose efflux permease
MGIKQTGVPLGGLLAAGTVLLGAMLGWQTALMVLAGVSLIATLPCMMIAGALQPRRAAATTFFSVWPTLLANRNLGAISLATAGFNICQASYFGFLTLFMKDAVGVSHTLAGLSLGLSQAAAAGGRVAWGVIGDRAFSGRRKSLYAYLGASASLLFGLLACSRHGWTAFAIVGAVALGLTVGSYAAIVQTMVVEAVPPDQAGTASGYYLFLISLGNMLGPLLFGMLVDLTGSYNIGWAFLAVMGTLATGVLLVGFSDQRQWRAEHEPGAPWATKGEARHQ